MELSQIALLEGKLEYARWLTIVNRILRIYITFESPFPDLVIMCRYIIKVYSRNWLAIKKTPYFYDSPQNILNMIQHSHKFNDITNSVHDVICTHSYLLHSENMIWAMMTNMRPNVRMRDVGKILKRDESDDAMRIFKKHIVNFSADDYYYLIDDNSIWLESILTKDISTAYLRLLDINNICMW